MSDPVDRLRVVCAGYLSFAHDRPERYRLMFGTPWADNSSNHPANDDLDRSSLGLNAFAVLQDALDECVRTGASTSRDTVRDTTALWVGLHGLAGLRETTPSFPWPDGLGDDLVTTLARLQPSQARAVTRR